MFITVIDKTAFLSMRPTDPTTLKGLKKKEKTPISKAQESDQFFGWIFSFGVFSSNI